MVTFLLLNVFLIAVDINIEIIQQKDVSIIALQAILLIIQHGIVFKSVHLVYLLNLLIRLAQKIVRLDIMLITKLIFVLVYVTPQHISIVIIQHGNVSQLVLVYQIFMLIQILKNVPNPALEDFLLINRKDLVSLLLIVQIQL